MTRLKRTYALPAETLHEFESAVAPAERDQVISQLLDFWLTEHRSKRLRAEVIAGCQEMADVYLQTEQEYHPLEEEVERGLDPQPKTGRRRPRAPRSGRRL